MPAVTLITPLPFSLELKNSERLTTVGEAVIYFTRLSRTQRAKHYWERAIQTLNAAVNEAAYLPSATINLQTALAMDGLLVENAEED